MQIKQQALAQQLQKKTAPLYFIIGQDNYLLEDCVNLIKRQLSPLSERDEQRISIQSPEDWFTVLEEAKSYSLFANQVVLDVTFPQKSLDAKGKKVFTEYLQAINPKCVIIVRAPNLAAKQLAWLTQHEHALLIVTYPLNAQALADWLTKELRQRSIRFEPGVPDLVIQYTQGNMLACAQVIEKITLGYDPAAVIKAQHVLEQLDDQCDYSLYELIDACLLGHTDKSIHILRLAANNKTEPSLILWMLSQEVRILSQLTSAVQQKKDIKTTCSQLKVWPQRVRLYQAALKRFNAAALQNMLPFCALIDEQIKTGRTAVVWYSLERIALALSCGHFVSDL